MDEIRIPPPWEEVKDQFVDNPNDPGLQQTRRYYEGQRSLAEQRQVESRRTEESAGSYLGRRAIPFASAAYNFDQEREAANARERLNRGVHEIGDATLVARHERTKQIDEERGLVGQSVSALAHAPAIVGEFAAGGAALGGFGAAAEGAGVAARFGSHALRAAAITPFIPSSYLPQMAEDNQRAGRDVTDLRGLPAAVAVGAVNNLVLGSLQGIGSFVPGATVGRFAARNILRAGAGVVEQGIADVLTGVSGLSTGTGTAGDVMAGRFGDAAKHALVQAVTFAAFGALHDAKHGAPRRGPLGERLPEPATEKAKQEAAKVIEDTRVLVESGMPLDKATETVKEHWDAEHQAAQGPRPGEEAMPETTKTAENIPENIPTNTPAPETAQEAPGTPQTETVRPPVEAAPEAPAVQPSVPAAETTPTPAAEPAPAVEQRTPAQRIEAMRQRKQEGRPAEQSSALGKEHPFDEAAAQKWSDFEQYMRSRPEPIKLEPAEQKLVQAFYHEGKSLREIEAAFPELGSHETIRKKLNAINEKMGGEGTAYANVMREAAIRKESMTAAPEFGELDQNKIPLETKLEKVHQQLIDGKITAEEAVAESERLHRRSSVELVPELRAKIEKALSRFADPTKVIKEFYPEASRKEMRELIKLVQESKRANTEAGGDALVEDAARAANSGEAVKPDDAAKPAQAQQEPSSRVPPDNSRPGGQPSAASAAGVGPQGVGPQQQFDKLVRQVVREQTPIKQIGGGATTVPDPGLIQKATKKAVEVIHGFRDEVDRLSGKMFPAITRTYRELGEAAARWVSAPVAAKIGAPVMIDRVFGETTKPEVAQHWMDVLHEERARHNRAYNESEAERHRKEGVALINAGKGGTPEALTAAESHAHRKQMAADTHSFLGKEYSVPDEAAYQRTLASPEYQAFKKRWNSEMVPIQEANYKGAQGMDEHDVINSPSQLPGHAFNAIAERTPAVAMNALGGRGNLNNVKLKNNPFANEATMAATKYNTNYGDIITRTLAIGEATARKAEFIRLGVDKGEMEFAKPGQVDFKLPLGQESVEIKNVKPPKGTQDASLGETSLYVNKEIYAEMRQALQVDEPLSHGLMKHISDALTKTTLASSAETVYHFKNLLTALFKPGVNPLSLFSNMAKVIKGDMATRKRLVELARIGVGQSTEHGLESGSLWGGKTDPTTWSSKFLHVISDSVRLTGETAFESLANRGVEMTETNKRDFINQMTGQYNKAAQSKLVVWLRDIGLSPFATAASKFYMSGLQTLTGSHGLKTTGIAADLGLRAEVYGRIGLVLGSVALINALKWGNPLGDDDTPMGAIKLGTGADGKTSYFDLTSLTGLTRGARSAGLLALAEGVRKDQSPGRILDRASDQMLSSLIHIAEGPVVSFVHTAATGRNSLGQEITEKPPVSGSKFADNLKAAAQQANPLVSTLTGGGERRGQEQTMGQRALGLLGPFGPKFHGGEMVTELHQHLQDLADARTVATREGKRFDDEWKYRILHQISQRIAQHEHMANQDVRSGRRWFGQPDAVRDEGRIREIRTEQNRLARFGLEAIR